MNLFPMLAAYNQWANSRVYEAAAQLSDTDFRADCGAFFKSVHGTLNHLLVTDRIWLKRFTGAGEAPARLDETLFDGFDDLKDAREREDERLVAYVGRLDAPALEGRFRYQRATTPDWIEQPLAPALQHLFNHQAHHRGQVHCILTGLGGEGPALDLVIFQRQTGMGM